MSIKKKSIRALSDLAEMATQADIAAAAEAESVSTGKPKVRRPAVKTKAPKTTVIVVTPGPVNVEGDAPEAAPATEPEAASSPVPMEVGEDGPVADLPSEEIVADESPSSEDSRREAVITALLEYCDEDHTEQMREVYAVLPLPRLQEQLSLLEAEWGGSPQFKIKSDAIQRLFKSAANSQVAKERQSLLATKYAEYHKLCQKLEKQFGYDTVVNGLRLTEYHRALKEMIKHHSVLTRGVQEMAAMLQYREVADDTVTQDTAGMVPANTEELLRVLMSVGISAKNWLMTAEESRREVLRQAEHIERLTRELKAATTLANDLRDRAAAREEEIRRATSAAFGAKLALISNGGQFLGVKEGTSKLNPKTIELVDEIGEALLFSSESRIRLLYDKLRAWSKKDSQYAKTVARKGLHPTNWSIVRVTMTRV